MSTGDEETSKSLTLTFSIICGYKQTLSRDHFGVRRKMSKPGKLLVKMMKSLLVSMKTRLLLWLDMHILDNEFEYWIFVENDMIDYKWFKLLPTLIRKEVYIFS